jgi:transitional endoplasmic reticulum ATPase
MSLVEPFPDFMLPSEDPVEMPEIVQYWVHRWLLDMNGFKYFFNTKSYRAHELANELGIGTFLADDSEDDVDQNALFKHLEKTYRAIQQRGVSVPAVLAKNIQGVADLVGLNAVEVRVFEFVVLMQTYPPLKNVCAKPARLRSRALSDRLATLLNLPLQDTWEALRPTSTLARSGLVTRSNSRFEGGLDEFLELLTESLADRLIDSVVEPADWLKDMVELGKPSHLHWEDYKHLNPALSVLRPYLRQAVMKQQPGVNIFLYGPPGTGKTQLARLLAQDMGVDLYEVTTQGSDQEPIGGRTRVKALCAANLFFKQSQAMVLFDEVEEVFGSFDPDLDFMAMLGSMRRPSHARKAWLNQVLETNPLPTIWVANALNGLDPAFVRRFDMVVEMPVPPRSRREHIIRQAGGALLNEAAIASLSQSNQLAPGVVAKAVSVVQAVHGELSTPTSDAVHLLINNTLQAQGHQPVHPYSPDALPSCYDPSFVNADADLMDVTRRLQTARTGRLCLYGPPGTGKTAFGRWLADQLGVPLHVRRASDLLGMYVGESEKNIARAFAEAQADGGLLLIDEVDSFLQNRQSAQRSWEVSQVNEMLTQMESFSGVFIASTNLMDQLDPAVQRRFDLKVRFDPMNTAQATELLKHHCRDQGLQEPNEQELSQLQALKQLTPGDFASVKNQSRLRPMSSASDWLKALKAECALKPNPQSVGMGFV